MDAFILKAPYIAFIFSMSMLRQRLSKPKQFCAYWIICIFVGKLVCIKMCV